MNERITYREVQVIGPAKESLGVMKTSAALALAYEKGLDLVMVAEKDIPVCKIMDYGKYRFEQEKRNKEAKKKQQSIETKEIQLSCRIDVHDFETKVNHAIRFLTAGNKVRVVLRFKGREMSHQALGKEVLGKFKDAVSECGTVDKIPVLEGRLMTMIVNPLKPQKPAK